MRASRDSTVSVVIINYNNKDFLRQCLASALALDWPGLEVIVVDNSSSDGSPEMVEAEFGGKVRLLHREGHSPTAARNHGFNAARGEYILSLDNDMILGRDIVRKGVYLFEQFPKVAVLAFKIGAIENPEEPLPEHWWHPVSRKEAKDRFFFTDYFGEGAVFFRRDALMAVGGYDETLFRHFEGNDLSFRFLRDGYDMLYCPTLFCGELKITDPRSTKADLPYLSVRNRFWMVWKHYPVGRGFLYLSGRIGLAGYRAVRGGWMTDFFKGVKDGIFAPKAIREQRRPLSKNVWKRIQQMRRGIFWEADQNQDLGVALLRN